MWLMYNYVITEGRMLFKNCNFYQVVITNSVVLKPLNLLLFPSCLPKFKNPYKALYYLIVTYNFTCLHGPFLSPIWRRIMCKTYDRFGVNQERDYHKY